MYRTRTILRERLENHSPLEQGEACLLPVEAGFFQRTWRLPLARHRTLVKLVIRVSAGSMHCGIFTYVFTALADADPLGVNTNVTFDEVGGLDDRE